MFTGSDFITKSDVQIKTLKNVFTDHMHALFFQLNKTYEIPKKSIMDETYYLNTKLPFSISIYENDKKKLIHPKTLVYVIAYKSSQTNKFKKTIIVGADANLQKISGFDIIEARFKKYFENNKEKINEKFGYIFPTFWFATRIFLKDSPIIFLSTK